MQGAGAVICARSCSEREHQLLATRPEELQQSRNTLIMVLPYQHTIPFQNTKTQPHPNEWTLKYRKRYLWYSLSLMPDLLASARTVYFPNDPDEISSLLCMVSACH